MFKRQSTLLLYEGDSVHYCSSVTECIDHHLLGVSIIQSYLFKYLQSFACGSIMVLKKLLHARSVMRAWEGAGACVCGGWLTLPEP